MSILAKRDTYKPFKYQFAFEIFQKQHSSHWLPTEVVLHDDVSDWQYKLTKEERNLLTQVFRFFTTADIDVAAGYCNHFLPMFHHPELRMMMTSFAAMEGIHIWAYSLLLDTVGMPEVEYSAFQNFKEMQDKHEYLAEFKGKTKADVAKTLAVYSAFTEGLQLFSSFVILLNFPRHNKMKGMGQIVTWSIRDETLHVDGMIRVFRALIEENPRLWTDEFKKELYDIARKMIELEDAFIDLCFEMGGIEGLTADEVKKYCRYIADRRLLQLGLKPNWKIKDNPLPWVDWMVNGVEHANFFETRATEYSKGTVKGWDNAF